jgi:hypothetical protein
LYNQQNEANFSPFVQWLEKLANYPGGGRESGTPVTTRATGAAC